MLYWYVIPSILALNLHSVIVLQNLKDAVPEVRLDFYFSPQLVFHPSLLQLFLEEHLQGQDELTLPLSGQVDIAKFTLS